MKLGSLSAKYEGKPDSANPDNIGWAYGKYQFNSATGGLDLFFKFNSDIKKKFIGMTAGTRAFNNRWKQLAATMNGAFEEAQDRAAKEIWYNPAIKIAEKEGFDVSNRGVQETIFSIAINHGRYKQIIEKAAEKVKMLKPEDQVKQLYASRRLAVSSNEKLAAQTIKNLLARYTKEEEDALKFCKENDH